MVVTHWAWERLSGTVASMVGRATLTMVPSMTIRDTQVASTPRLRQRLGSSGGSGVLGPVAAWGAGVGASGCPGSWGGVWLALMT